MRVFPVPCLSDNYAYLVTADGSSEAFVVDPQQTALRVLQRGNIGVRHRVEDVDEPVSKVPYQQVARVVAEPSRRNGDSPGRVQLPTAD